MLFSRGDDIGLLQPPRIRTSGHFLRDGDLVHTLRFLVMQARAHDDDSHGRAGGFAIPLRPTVRVARREGGGSGQDDDTTSRGTSIFVPLLCPLLLLWMLV